MSSYVEMARAALATIAGPVGTDSPGQIETARSGGRLRPQDVQAGVNDPREPRTTAQSLKGHAVEVWCDHAGGRVFIVADEEDAQEAIRRFGARSGEVWIPGEIELVARIEDKAIRSEVAGFKRKVGGYFSTDANSEGVSPEAWKAAALNRLFREQGATGKPGRITAATARHGERMSNPESV
jgi:hypothetical protein